MAMHITLCSARKHRSTPRAYDLRCPTMCDVTQCIFNSLYSARKHLPHGPTIYDVQRCVHHDVTQCLAVSTPRAYDLRCPTMCDVTQCLAVSTPTGLRSTMSNDVTSLNAIQPTGLRSTMSNDVWVSVTPRNAYYYSYLQREKTTNPRAYDLRCPTMCDVTQCL